MNSEGKGFIRFVMLPKFTKKNSALGVHINDATQEEMNRKEKEYIARIEELEGKRN